MSRGSNGGIGATTDECFLAIFLTGKISRMSLKAIPKGLVANENADATNVVLESWCGVIRGASAGDGESGLNIQLASVER